MGLILGSFSDDNLFGDAAPLNINDSIYAFDGNDNVSGGDGNDTIYLGEGNDSVILGLGTSIAFGDSGNDVFYGQGGSYYFEGGSGNDTLYSNYNNFPLYGIPVPNNYLAGGDGEDYIVGGVGNDTLVGGQGNDYLYGGTGDDVYIVGSSEGADNDTIVDGGGTDLILSDTSYTLSNSLTIENLVLRGAGYFNFSGTGNDFNNFIAGNYGDNYLSGKGGNDTIEGGIGSDSIDGGLGSDLMDGGSGNDVYSVDDFGDVVLESSNIAQDIDEVYSSISYSLGSNVENLILTGQAVIGIGNSQNNIILGNLYSNTLYGGLGSDFMSGGSGDDVYYIDNAGDTVSETSNLATEIDQVYSSVSYSLSANVENLTLIDAAADGIGNSQNNVVIGNAFNNIIDGALGSDFMSGGSGNDVYYIDNAGDIVSETSTLATEIDQVYSSISYSLGANVEKLILTGAAISGTGNSLNNTILGNVSNNILNGGLGSDIMTGGLGNDAFVLHKLSGLDTVTDFTVSDKLQISASEFGGGLVSGIGLNASQILSGAGVTQANTLTQRFLFNTNNGALYFDYDGTGSGGSVQIALLSNVNSLSFNNFVLIA
jgi:serralysin